MGGKTQPAEAIT